MYGCVQTIHYPPWVCVLVAFLSIASFAAGCGSSVADSVVVLPKVMMHTELRSSAGFAVKGFRVLRSRVLASCQVLPQQCWLQDAARLSVWGFALPCVGVSFSCVERTGFDDGDQRRPAPAVAVVVSRLACTRLSVSDFCCSLHEEPAVHACSGSGFAPCALGGYFCPNLSCCPGCLVAAGSRHQGQLSAS